MNLFINTSSDPSTSLANSLIDNSNINLQSLFLGDSLPLKVCFTDGEGGYASWNGEAGLKVKVAVGLLATNSLYVLEENFTFSDNSYSGNLTLFTNSLASALDGFDFIDAVFEIQVNRSNGDSITTLQVGCSVFNQLIGSSSINPIADSDGDGIANEDESNDTRITKSKQLLDTYIEDTETDIVKGDIVKFIENYNGTPTSFKTGEYYEVYSSNINENGNYFIQIVFNNENNWINSTNWRGIKFIKIKPDPNIVAGDQDGDGFSLEPDQDDENPNLSPIDLDGDGVLNTEDSHPLDPTESSDSDSDGVGNNSNYTQTKSILDSYSLDTYKTLGVGDIIKILKDLTLISGNYKQGDYYIAENVNINDQSILINGTQWTGGRGSRFEIVNPSDQLTPEPTFDSDGDGVDDDVDYFSNNENYSQTQAELDAYSLDTYKTPSNGDVIKILTDWIINNVTLNQNTYHIIENVNTSNVKVTIDGVIYYPNFSARGTKWEIVNPSDQLTPEPIIDSDSDGVQDSDDYFSNNSNYTQTKSELDGYSLDTFKDFELGDIVKILVNFSGKNEDQSLTHNFINGDYHIVTFVGAYGIRLEQSGENYLCDITQKGSKFEIVNPSDQLTDDPNPPLPTIEVRIVDYTSNGGFLFNTTDYSIFNGVNMNFTRNPEFFLQKGQTIKWINETDYNPLYLFYKLSNGDFTALRDPNNHNNPISIIGQNTGASGTPWIREVTFDLDTDYMYNTSGYTNQVWNYIRIQS